MNKAKCEVLDCGWMSSYSKAHPLGDTIFCLMLNTLLNAFPDCCANDQNTQLYLPSVALMMAK